MGLKELLELAVLRTDSGGPRWERWRANITPGARYIVRALRGGYLRVAIKSGRRYMVHDFKIRPNRGLRHDGYLMYPDGRAWTEGHNAAALHQLEAAIADGTARTVQ